MTEGGSDKEVRSFSPESENPIPIEKETPMSRLEKKGLLPSDFSKLKEELSRLNTSHLPEEGKEELPWTREDLDRKANILDSMREAVAKCPPEIIGQLKAGIDKIFKKVKVSSKPIDELSSLVKESDALVKQAEEQLRKANLTEKLSGMPEYYIGRAINRMFNWWARKEGRQINPTAERYLRASKWEWELTEEKLGQKKEKGERPQQLEPKKEFTNPYLQIIATRLDKMSVGALERVEGEILSRVASGSLPDEEADRLLALISNRIGQTQKITQVGEEITRVFESALKDLSIQIGELKRLLEQSGQVRPSLSPEEIAKMTTKQVMDYSEQQTKQMRGIFGRVDRETERARWVDVEHNQEFYTRFTPNMEPYFYSDMESSEERDEWDARWKLARAAYYKKIYSAFPDKLAENQDLIELTKEQMEMLYRLPGVKTSLEWYTSAIVKGDKHVPDPEKPNELLKDEEGKPLTILGCKSGREFEKFRKKLREDIEEEVRVVIAKELIRKEFFKINKESYQEQSRDEKKATDKKVNDHFNGLSEPERKTLLDSVSEVEIKSADAIAWNWVWCSNLAESIDSRYSRSKGKRHDGLAPAVCSDDLRAVFHPQEKFEDKCQKHQEWGNFGKWGHFQMERIMKPFKKEMKEKWKREDKEKKEAKRRNEERVGNVFRYKYIFRGASLLSDFWTVDEEQITEELEEIKKGDEIIIRIYTKKIPVKVPECYPITSMKSFWEASEDGRGNNLLDCLLDRTKIEWDGMQADLWKTIYLTIRLRKAVGLFEVFTKESKEGWARALNDIYTRLGIYRGSEEESVLRDYYISLGLSEEKAGRLAGKHFHNLKVWAVYAVQGGVGRPQDRNVTDPYSESALEVMHRTARRDHEALLRKPQVGYLERGLFGLFGNEDLIINSIE